MYGSSKNIQWNFMGFVVCSPVVQEQFWKGVPSKTFAEPLKGDFLYS